MTSIEGSSAGVTRLPFSGGLRAIVWVHVEKYVPGQQVVVEVYATTDLPDAKETLIGRATATVKGNGKADVRVLSDPLPETRSEWKIKYTYSPRADGKDTNSPSEFTARREPPPVN